MFSKYDLRGAIANYNESNNGAGGGSTLYRILNYGMGYGVIDGGAGSRHNKGDGSGDGDGWGENDKSYQAADDAEGELDNSGYGAGYADGYDYIWEDNYEDVEEGKSFLLLPSLEISALASKPKRRQFSE